MDNKGKGTDKQMDKQMDKGTRMTLWERYIAMEVGIEFKACLYFFCILFFYSVYRIMGGRYEASILHMTEMIFLAYGMGYVQVGLLSNFDEAQQLGVREVLYMLLCSGIYAAAAFVFKWFEGAVPVSGIFMLYMLLIYFCAFLVYKTKRDMDAKQLNDDLKAFQARER